MFETDVYAQAPFAAHYILGFVALGAIGGALASRKGSSVHVWSGRVFVVGMIVAALTAYYFVTVQFAVPVLFDATLMMVAAGSAVLALQPRANWVVALEMLLTVVSLAAALALSAAGVQFLLSGSAGAIPASIHAAIFWSFFVGDLGFRSPDKRRTHRVRRHLYRMAWAIAIGIYAPLFTFREEFGLSNQVVYLGAMALGPLVLLIFWGKAKRLDGAV